MSRSEKTNVAFLHKIIAEDDVLPAQESIKALLQLKNNPTGLD
jgi:hypothetical protein